MLPFVHTLFNRIFLSVFFPQAWPESISVPVFKKGVFLTNKIIQA